MKPILLSTEMVRAILDSRKTVMRQVIKGADPDWSFTGLSNDIEIIGCDRYGMEYPKHVDGVWATFEGWNGYTDYPCFKAPYQPGDILYVRETFLKEWNGEFYYRADFDSDYLSPCEALSGGYPEYCIYHPGCEGCSREPERILWRPAIHMPKEAARIFLRVTDVRVEPLWNMRLKDCLEEGVILTSSEIDDHIKAPIRARERYSAVWDSTIKPKDRSRYGWAANPWVWVIEFERISKEDAMK